MKVYVLKGSRTTIRTAAGFSCCEKTQQKKQEVLSWFESSSFSEALPVGFTQPAAAKLKTFTTKQRKVSSDRWISAVFVSLRCPTNSNDSQNDSTVCCAGIPCCFCSFAMLDMTESCQTSPQSPTKMWVIVNTLDTGNRSCSCKEKFQCWSKYLFTQVGSYLLFSLCSTS